MQNNTTKKMAAKPRRRFRLKFTGVLIVLFVITLGAYILCSTSLRAYNISLNNEKQATIDAIATLKLENELASIEIKELTDYDRVMEIAGSNDMAVENGSVTSIAY